MYIKYSLIYLWKDTDFDDVILKKSIYIFMRNSLLKNQEVDFLQNKSDLAILNDVCVYICMLIEYMYIKNFKRCGIIYKSLTDEDGHLYKCFLLILNQQ